MTLTTVALARRLLLAGLVIAGSAGCNSCPAETKNSRAMNRQMDRFERMGDDLSRRENGGTVRSQAPGENRVDLAPTAPGQSRVAQPVNSVGQSRVNLTPNAPGESRVNQIAAAPNKPADPTLLPVSASAPNNPAKITGQVTPITGQAQVRVVANVGSTPIYESEVREAVNQRLSEILGLPEQQRKAKEKQAYAEELRRIVERELVLDELFAKLKGKGKPASILGDLQDAAAKEADRRLRDFKQRTNVSSDEEFKELLMTQGLTVPGLRRQVERSFMMQAYLRELLKPRLDAISLGDLRDYYDEHGDEFKVEDGVKWQDLFLNAAQFGSRAEAKSFAESLAERARKGDDFLALVKEHDRGLGNGTGQGEKRGEIRPVDAEPIVFNLRAGEVGMFEIETGFHIVRVVERTYAGRRPFDEKTQMEIRRRVQNSVTEREYQRIVETLWRRIKPQILVSEP